MLGLAESIERRQNECLNSTVSPPAEFGRVTAQIDQVAHAVHQREPHARAQADPGGGTAGEAGGRD